MVALEDKEIDSNLEVISKQIMDAYRLLSAKKLIKNTGASKVLHLLNPKLFVIWDNDIRQHYLSSHTGHPIGSPECYFHFLRQMHDELEEVLRVEPKAPLLEDLYSIAGYAKTLPKALDEYNFVHKSEWKTKSQSIRRGD